MKVLFEGELLADYFQMYVADDVESFNDDYPTEFGDEVFQRRVNLGRGIIVVQTARNMTVPFRVELHEAEPAVDLEVADHAVECGIATSGAIMIAGMMDYTPDAARAPVPPGDLRALVVSTGLGTLSDDGLDGEDAYVMHLWPGAGDEVIVRKQWVEG